MKREKVDRLVRERCKDLDERGKGLVTEALLRLPERFKLGAIKEVSPIYCGTAYGFREKEWAIFIDWNILNRPSEVKGDRAKEEERRKAIGVIALNLAHYALKHYPSIIHSKESYEAARALAMGWGFKREIEAMEEAYL